ncbi:MAG: hypothetical protein ABEJ23_07425 [Haloarculaceae archaeon]
MRISRDVVRPLVALVVIVAAVSLVSTVAAYRTANTQHPRPDSVSCQKAEALAQRDPAYRRIAERCEQTRGLSSTGETRREEAREHGERSSSGRRVVVVTRSGAS